MKCNGRTLYREREAAGLPREAVAAHMYPGADPAVALDAIAQIEATNRLDPRTMARHRAAVAAAVNSRPAQAAPAVLMEPVRARAEVSIAVLAGLTRLERADVEATMHNGQADPVKAAAVAAALVSLLGSKLELAAEREQKAREKAAELRVQLADEQSRRQERAELPPSDAALLLQARELDGLMGLEVEGPMSLMMRFRRLLGREAPRALERMVRRARALEQEAAR